MIAKLIPRKHGTGSFKDSVNYNLGLSRGEKDKVEYVNTRDIFAPGAAAAEMAALAMENTRSKDPVFNCVLSWRENEIPTREQADGAVGIVLAELGLEGCQTHYALHRNTQNLHLHICVNRIDPETLKARDPAHGWTKKALEKAARKIELAQGWDVEQSGRYLVTPGGEILEKSREDKGLVLSQTARDIEAHTAEKSAERVAQETAAPVIREAKTWEELHRKLAERGIAFERKGSGATLRVGETVIKASKAGRDISLSKLEKRLGAFIQYEGTVKPMPPQPIECIESVRAINDSWRRYQNEKAGYFKAKREAFAELRARHRDERKTMLENQCQARTSALAVSWKGRGAELNRLRSVTAAGQKGESLALRDRQRDEREELKRCFPMQFPGFKAWLSMEDDPELLLAFRYPGRPAMCVTGDEGYERDSLRGGKHDLRDYTPVFGAGRGGVMYRRNGNATADFIDYGRVIVFPKDYDRGGVLAALQLASQKWGSVKISGSDEYKKLCAEIAAEHGIRLSNPELAQTTGAQERSRGRGR